MLSCRESTSLMSEARERPLSFGERMALRMHLAMCSGCRRFNRQMDVLREASRRFSPLDGDFSAPDDKDPLP